MIARSPSAIRLMIRFIEISPGSRHYGREHDVTSDLGSSRSLFICLVVWRWREDASGVLQRCSKARATLVVAATCIVAPGNRATHRISVWLDAHEPCSAFRNGQAAHASHCGRARG